MSVNFTELAGAGVQKLHPYIAGKPVSELERELGISNIIKLASNENPLGMSPLVEKALQSEFAEITRYPDSNGHYLKSALADKHGLDANQITLGNGSNDVLEIIARVFVQPQHEVIFSQYAFCVYPLVAQGIGAKLVEVPAKNYGNDLDAMLAAITDDTRIIFLANPNNPTGTWLGEEPLKAFLNAVPKNVLVVVDEAYTEYVTDNSIPNCLTWLPEFDNLIVTRTFSKAYGLASLRLGFSASNEEIAGLLNRIRQPFNVNSFAMTAGIAAIQDDKFLSHSVEVNSAGMQQIIESCKALNLDYIPSKGNFVTIDMAQDAQPVYQALLHKGVIVRPVANYKMPNHLRVSIGTEQENARYAEAIREVLAG